MAEPTPPGGDWYGVSALLTSVGALVTSLARGRKSNGGLHAVDKKVAVLESRYDDIERRLEGMDGKLDRLMERMR